MAAAFLKEFHRVLQWQARGLMHGGGFLEVGTSHLVNADGRHRSPDESSEGLNTVRRYLIRVIEQNIHQHMLSIISMLSKHTTTNVNKHFNSVSRHPDTLPNSQTPSASPVKSSSQQSFRIHSSPKAVSSVVLRLNIL